MPKSRADYIREELEKNFDVKAEEIIERLAKKGIRCQAQQIYQIRSVLRHSKSKTKTMVPVPRRKVKGPQNLSDLKVNFTDLTAEVEQEPVSDYQLLREAVIRLAKQKKFDNPEGLPDTLIRVHREFTQLEKRLETEYSSLFSSK